MKSPYNEIKLGQKVKYQNVIEKKKRSCFLSIKDYTEAGQEKELTRRERKTLKEQRVGYVMGKRNIVFNTVYEEHYNEDPDGMDFIMPKRQDYRKVFIIAWSWGKTDYVLEQDLSLIIYGYDEMYKAKGE